MPEMTPERLEEIRRVHADSYMGGNYEPPNAEAYECIEAIPDLLSHIERQAAEIAALREALAACADDLADEINGRLHHGQMRPDERRRYERDMEPVDKARRLLHAPEGAKEG